jgi:hypothetical protein
MDFREELKIAADECVAKQLHSAEHLIRQAFYDGVAFEMNRRRAPNIVTGVQPCPHGYHPKECSVCR